MARPLRPPFSNFTCFTDFSCILPMFHNFIQLFPSLPLFLNLRPTGRTSSFILCSPPIKTHVHRQPNITSLPLRTAQTSYQKTHLKLCISLVRLCILSHFVAFRTSSQPIAPHPYTYIFSLFSHSSHRLLKKGLTSTCTFLTFCRFILLQAYHRGSTSLPSPLMVVGYDRPVRLVYLTFSDFRYADYSLPSLYYCPLSPSCIYVVS
jgi:hypothetical protein